MTIHIFGTSVSIARGYATELAETYNVRNWSIGDQTSVIGLMRAHMASSALKPGDTAVWEYPLLDIMLAHRFGIEEIRSAFRQALGLLSDRGINRIALFSTPKAHIQEPTATEIELKEIATEMGCHIIDVRNIFKRQKIVEPEALYFDDRHMHAGTSVQAEVIRLILAAAEKGPPFDAPGVHERWRWIPAGGNMKSFTNSFVSVDTIELLPNSGGFTIPKTCRVVAVGVVATRTSGACWCGHPGCPPASIGLPEGSMLPFLLRATRLPCVRATVDFISAAPSWATSNGVWMGYNHRAWVGEAPIHVFGALIQQ
jgi:hypothetical protein